MVSWNCAEYNPHSHGQDWDVLTDWTRAKNMNRTWRRNFTPRLQLRYGIVQIFTGRALPKFLLGHYDCRQSLDLEQEGSCDFDLSFILLYMKPAQIQVTAPGCRWDASVSFQGHLVLLSQEPVPVNTASLPPKQQCPTRQEHVPIHQCHKNQTKL